MTAMLADIAVTSGRYSGCVITFDDAETAGRIDVDAANLGGSVELRGR